MSELDAIFNKFVEDRVAEDWGRGGERQGSVKAGYCEKHELDLTKEGGCEKCGAERTTEALRLADELSGMVKDAAIVILGVTTAPRPEQWKAIVDKANALRKARGLDR